jgi:hypothetical protein
MQTCIGICEPPAAGWLHGILAKPEMNATGELDSMCQWRFQSKGLEMEFGSLRWKGFIY